MESPPQNSRPSFFLVDGSNYLFRAFYAIRDLSNSRGFPTNAIYGFTTMLLKLLREHQPDFIAVAFDVKGPTFRHDAYEGYKANRKAIPETLIPQIPCVKQVVQALGIPLLEQPGIEADDILGTLAAAHAGPDLQVVIVSGDKDLLQLVSEDVSLYDPMKEKRYDPAAVQERFGVVPACVADILALAGDTSDNIPGIPGIGPKGAERLIQEFGSVEGVLANTGKIRNARTKAAVEAHGDLARLSLELTRIRLDCKVDFDFEKSRRQKPDLAVLRELFREFEFSSLLQDLKDNSETPAGHYETIEDEASLQTCVEEIRAAGAVALECLATPSDPLRATLFGLALSPVPDRAFYLPLEGTERKPSTASLSLKHLRDVLPPLLADGSILKYGHDLKTISLLLMQQGLSLEGLACDTLLGAWCINPTRRGYALADVYREYADDSLAMPREMASTGTRPPIPEAMTETERVAWTCSRADAARNLAPILWTHMEREGLKEVFHDIEMPLVLVLAGMERHGVLVDTALLQALSAELRVLIELSAEKIYRLAGERFNINSSKQLQAILFEKLRLPRGRKTKEGYSTDVDVLTQLAKGHELPGEILSYRSLSKLKSTYVDALPLLVHPGTGRIHTTYNQAGTATGRLSSSNPNLQNIPIRTVEGRRIRQAFIAPPGWGLLTADYSQVELRVLAHLSGDPTLLEAFASGEDIHSRTASNLFGVFPEMVNDAMRRQAKVINFGILYGMSAFGLARELDVPQKLAQAYIDEYFRKYGDVRAYLDRTLDRARRDGFVTTLFGRRRPLPELHADNAVVRQFAERMAINTPIQGTAADLIKLAMLRVEQRLRKEKLQARMVLQVHDELVFEVPEAEREVVERLAVEEMERVVSLAVPLKVDRGYGRNWDEAKG